MLPKAIIYRFLLIATACVFLAGCASPTQTVLPTSTVLAPQPTVPPSPSPTPPPTKLTICTAEAPGSLYRYAPQRSASRDTFFSLLYSGDPLQAPEFKLEPVKVKLGDLIMDAHGDLAVLAAGTQVRPSGCNTPDCEVAWDGTTELTLDQLVLTYTVADNSQWSDGVPITAQDMLLSYHLASDPVTAGSKQIFEFTQKVATLEDKTFQWFGLPGFTRVDPKLVDWKPMPSHQLQSFSPERLKEEAIAASKPLGWGPYQWSESQEESVYNFVPNGNAIDAAAPWTQFDHVQVRIVEDRDTALTELANGSCDVLDASYPFDASMLAGFAGTAHVLEPVEMSELVFGIVPAAYDNGQYAAATQTRPDFFGDLRTRQAVAQCLQADDIGDNLLRAYLPENHPYKLPIQSIPNSDNSSALELLNAVGWVDEDLDAATPLVAQGVPGVPDGTVFQVKLHTSLSQADAQAATLIAESLGKCGIGVEVVALPVAELYAPGQNSLLFGRKFDLALVYWQGTTTNSELCTRYLASQIPDTTNEWIGTNLAGLNNPDFDSACLSGLGSGLTPGMACDDDCLSRLALVPSIKLIPHPRIWLSRPGLEW